jgi:hypothetical protein
MWLLAPVLALAVLLGGCGSSPTQVDSSELRVSLNDFRIVPASIVVHAGRLKVRACNVGHVAHSARIEQPYTGVDGSPIVLGGSPVVLPGQCSVGMKFMLAPGTYKLVDAVSNHADLGDFATVVVK